MTSTVVIESPNPNHNLLVVVQQTLDDTGNPCGDPVEVAVLDDGQRYVGHVWKNQVLTVVERPRNAAGDVTSGNGTTVPVIGGGIFVANDGDGGGEGGEGGGEGGGNDGGA